MIKELNSEEPTDARWDLLGKSALPQDQFREAADDVNKFLEEGRIHIERILSEANGLGIEIHFGSALDFGCGLGRQAQALCRHFKHVTGVDVWAAVVAEANKLNKFVDKCDYLVNKSSDLSRFQDGTFDMIHSYVVLQHIHPSFSMKYISEFARVLHPGGLLVFQLPSRRRDSTFARRFRLILNPHLPTTVLKTIMKTRYGSVKRTRYEMYEIKRERVVRLLAELDLKVIAVTPDNHLLGWESFWYWCEKRKRVTNRT